MEGSIFGRRFLKTLDVLSHRSEKLKGKINFDTMPKMI